MKGRGRGGKVGRRGDEGWGNREEDGRIKEGGRDEKERERWG